MRLRWSRFDALSARELHDLLWLRNRVLVVEQASPYPDVDGRDPGAHHLALFEEGGTAVIGCARALGPGSQDDPSCVSFGRLAVDPAWRGKGLGRVVVAECLSFLARTWPDHDVSIGAQLYLESFYGGFGFRRASDVYDDVGIPHIDMRRPARG